MSGLVVLLLAVAVPLGIVVFTVIATESERKTDAHIPLNRFLSALIQWFSWGYTGFLICGSLTGFLIDLTTNYGDLSGVGCNFYDALLVGIDCHGFIGAQAIEMLVGFPLLIVQLSAVFFSSPIGFFFVLLLWLPVLVSFYWLLKRLTSRSEGRAASGSPLS